MSAKKKAVKKEQPQLSMNLDLGKENPDGIVQAQVALNHPEKLKELPLAERIARTCHEVNKSFCEGHGDFSQVSWDEAPAWVHDSALQGVNYSLQNDNARPQDMHDSWVAQKVEDGWVYGEVKDADKKEHPCMVSYRELPLQQRTKDSLFLSVVKSFI
tara:strand:- start:35327 stop:35800 length:474 start_codon:yes stop_codon:yes gene_type:complete